MVQYFVQSVPSVSSSLQSDRDILQARSRVVDLPLKPFIELGTQSLLVGRYANAATGSSNAALELAADTWRQNRPHGHTARDIARHSRSSCLASRAGPGQV